MGKDLINLIGLARELGLSRNWLKAEAVARRIPSLKAGRRLLFSLPAVKAALADRAALAPATQTNEANRSRMESAHATQKK